MKNKAFQNYDSVSIVQLSFECGTFTTVDGIYKQILGTCMGNQTSPIRSEIAVSAIEKSWHRSVRNMLSCFQLLEGYRESCHTHARQYEENAGCPDATAR